MTEQRALIDAASRSLRAYALMQMPDYLLPDHLSRLSNALMRVEAGQCKRLIVTMPPRHGKSQLCSNFFPAWYLGRNPSAQLITSTYNQEFADDFGRKVRDLITSPVHQSIFPKCVLRSDTQSVSRMVTKQGGVYYAVGVGGPTTGRGADLFLIDDPIKDRVQADSDTYRDRLTDWFSGVAYTRLMPGGAIVIVMTRWHEDDLVGQLLRKEGLDWEHINMPAIVGDKALWGERYSIDDLKQTKRVMTDYDWQSLYMQEPTPRDGVLFSRDHIIEGIDAKFASYVISMDPAISEEQGADETAIAVLGLRWGKPTRVDEVLTVHGQWTYPKQLDMIRQIYNEFHAPRLDRRVNAIIIEDVAYQKALIQQLSEYDLPVIALKVTKHKWLRANYITPWLREGRVRINTDALKKQMLRFRGKGEKNDLVDAFVNGITYIKDYESDGFQQELDNVQGLSQMDGKLKRYIDRERLKALGVNQVFNDAPVSYGDADYF